MPGRCGTSAYCRCLRRWCAAAAAGRHQLERPAPSSRVDAGLAMIHHPLLAAAGALAGVGTALFYARWQRLPLGAHGRCAGRSRWPWGWPSSNWARCWPGRAMEPKPAVRWAVTYTNPLAARWSGTPLGIPLHPVQAYAALAFLTLSIFLLVWLPATAAGRCGRTVADGDRRGRLHHRVVARSRGPRRAAGRRAGWAAGLAAIVLVLAGALVLLERKPPIASARSGKGAQG
jgi:phosphatidylglycerol:prolipoprotein diacylglycerol transferase